MHTTAPRKTSPCLSRPPNPAVRSQQPAQWATFSRVDISLRPSPAQGIQHQPRLAAVSRWTRSSGMGQRWSNYLSCAGAARLDEPDGRITSTRANHDQTSPQPPSAFAPFTNSESVGRHSRRRRPSVDLPVVGDCRSLGALGVRGQISAEPAGQCAFVSGHERASKFLRGDDGPFRQTRRDTERRIGIFAGLLPSSDGVDARLNSALVSRVMALRTGL